MDAQDPREVDQGGLSKITGRAAERPERYRELKECLRDGGRSRAVIKSRIRMQ